MPDLAEPITLQPHLRRNGAATQLFVDGRPMLLTAGEVDNSSGTSRAWMAPIWEKCAQAKLNTVLAAVPWDLLEPEEGQFDFDVIDGLLEDARAHDMRLIPLWFGAWKNGLSHYCPLWVKADQRRFPRTLTRFGNLEMLSTHSTEAREADARAFAALMRRIREKDGGIHTIPMIQLENEVGLNGDVRDRHPDAEKAYNSQVPRQLVDYLVANEDNLLPETLEFWASRKREGTWADLFGDDDSAGAVFMAWSYADFLEEVAAAGRAEYPIPVFANAALAPFPGTNRVHGPHARGGPRANVMDIWRAAAPSIEMLSPDIYRPDYEATLQEFNRLDNPLFVPEARPEHEGAANAFYTFGIGGIGYSPFGVENRIADHANGPMTQAYRLIRQISDVILQHQSAGTITAARVHPDQTEQQLDFGGYHWRIARVHHWRTPKIPMRDWGYCMIMQTGPDEFLVAGTGIQIEFSKPGEERTVVGLGSVDEVDFRFGRWERRRRLSGDEIMHSYSHEELNADNQTGTMVKFWEPEPLVMRVKLYAYQK